MSTFFRHSIDERGELGVLIVSNVLGTLVGFMTYLGIVLAFAFARMT